MPIDPKQLLKDQSFLSASPDEQSQYVSSFDPDFAKASREDQAAYLSHVTGKPTSFGISAGNGAPPMPKAPYQKMQMEEDTGPTTVKEAIDQTLAKNPANFTGKRALDLATNPIVDPEVYKTLGRGAVSTGEMIGGMPSAIYHAFKDKATPEEMQKSPSVYGGNSFRKGLRRLSGVDAMDVAEAAYRDKNSGAFGNIDSVPKVTPESALEVAPEAIGQGAGTVIAGKLTDIGMNIPKVVADATAPARNALAQKIVSPMTFENVGETAADVRTGTDPARGIVDEGLVGTKKGLAGAPNKPGKIDARLGELKSSADNILQNHPNSRQLIDAEPIIDSAIDKAIGETQKIAGSTSRLEELRTALKTKYGKTQGTPYEINNLKTDIQKAASDLGAYKNTQPIEASIARAMGDTANRLKNAVNEKVPEAADLNQRMSDLIDAKAGITRKVNAAKGEDLFGGHTGITGKVAQRVLGNAPVRTGIARVLNAGNVKGVPSSQNYIPPQIRGLLPSAPIELGSEMEPIGEPSQTGRPPIPGEAENVTRAERKGLLLPERAGMSRPIQMGSEMEPIGQPSTPQSELPYRPSLQQPPAFVAPGQIKPAGPPQDLLFPNESPGDFPAGKFPPQGDLFQTPVTPDIVQRALTPESDVDLATRRAPGNNNSVALDAEVRNLQHKYENAATTGEKMKTLEKLRDAQDRQLAAQGIKTPKAKTSSAEQAENFKTRNKPRVENHTMTKQGAELDNAMLQKVKTENPNLPLGEQLQKAAKLAKQARGGAGGD